MNTTAVRLAVLAGAAAVAAAAGYEGPRTFQASEILKPDFGAIEAEGRSMLMLRELETKAIAEVNEVSKSDVFLKAAGASVANVGKGVFAAVSDPVTRSS